MFRWRFGRDPTWRELHRLQRRMYGLCNVTAGTPKRGMTPLWHEVQLFPPVNMRGVDHAFVLTAELPGIKTDDLEVKIEDDTLTLKGQRKPQEVGEGVSYLRRERAAGVFQRSLALPGKVDVEHVAVAYKDGVLTITVPKK